MENLTERVARDLISNRAYFKWLKLKLIPPVYSASSLQEYLTHSDELTTGANTLQGYALETGLGSSIVIINNLYIGLLSDGNVILGDGTGYETTMPAHDRVKAKIPGFSVIDRVTAFIANLPGKKSYLVDFHSPYTNHPVGLIKILSEQIFANL